MSGVRAMPERSTKDCNGKKQGGRKRRALAVTEN